MTASSVPSPTVKRTGDLSLLGLASLVVGSMVGAGIFGMPQQMAAGTAMGPLLLGWAIAGIGVLALALVFQNLATQRADLDAGIFSYARAALGDLVGGLTAWGYWLAALFGNVAYVVLIMATLSQFFPGLGHGENLLATVIGSLIAWLYVFLISRGIREASGVNALVTVAKIVPLLVFIVMGVVAFKVGVAFEDVWGKGAGLGSVVQQMASMMLITVWAFLGIEGASNFSARARNRRDIGRATIIGFLTVLVLLVAVNVLSYGIVHRAELAGYPDPSMAGVLKHAVGPWGATLVSVGVLLAVGGAFLSWQLICAEILDSAAQQGLMPRMFSKRNKHDMPSRAILAGGLTVQFFLLLNLLVPPSGDVRLYTRFISLASSMSLLPYLFSALYQVILAVRHRGDAGHRVRPGTLAIGLVALLYSIWLVYAGGLGYLLTSALLYAFGLPFFLWARRERHERLLGPKEAVVVVVLLLAAIAGAWMLLTGRA